MKTSVPINIHINMSVCHWIHVNTYIYLLFIRNTRMPVMWSIKYKSKVSVIGVFFKKKTTYFSC